MTNDFDVAAKNYDQLFTFSKIGMAQRDLVYRNLEAILKPNQSLNILELNCGTGYDAINFAKKGHQVLATDVSEGMINVAKSKNNLQNLTFKTLDINLINEATFDTKFDIIFSNFGGLNCLSPTEIEAFLSKTEALLSKNGKLIAIIMPKHCLWEQAYFTLKGEFKKAKRRFTNQFIYANVDTVSVKTWYYNPSDMISISKTHFNINKLKPIGLSIPPSYLETSVLTKKIPLSIFKKIDTILTQRLWAKYADHFLIELQRK